MAATHPIQAVTPAEWRSSVQGYINPDANKKAAKVDLTSCCLTLTICLSVILLGVGAWALSLDGIQAAVLLGVRAAVSLRGL